MRVAARESPEARRLRELPDGKDRATAGERYRSSNMTDASAPQQDINRTSTAGVTRRVGEREDAEMPAENVAHARLQHRSVGRRSQPAAVHDAHAAMARATALDETPHASVGLRGRHAVHIERVARLELAALRRPQLAAVDAVRGKRALAVHVRGSRLAAR